MYDISGALGAGNTIKSDWQFLTEVLKISESPNYLHHNGKPVVGIWGPGFPDRFQTTATMASDLISWLKETAGVYVIGGVPSNWRTLDGDSRPEPVWNDVYASYDAISPWSVGRFNSATGLNTFYRERVGPDLTHLGNSNQAYIPVVWPGFSWHNMNSSAPLNDIPRQGGQFFSLQSEKIRVMDDIHSVFIAMFDEVDEGTAMFKLTESAAMLPVGADLIPLNADGVELPSDYYLRLVADLNRFLSER